MSERKCEREANRDRDDNCFFLNKYLKIFGSQIFIISYKVTVVLDNKNF